MNRYLRQSSLINEQILKTPISVIGAGGIGSFFVLAIAKMGFSNIQVMDFDTIEEHNLSNQFYRDKDIGKEKVTALAEIVSDFCGISICAVIDTFTKNHPHPGGVVVSAVDSMKAREMIFTKFQKSSTSIGFMDGRMGADQAEVYTVFKPEEHGVYRKTL